ncbi:LOW QUALITY PROTEIN: hypothetical protein PHPALM_29597 [Phytophthora palmivora]|uniref:Retrotransposon gag domain-containing protein n=1 Tax=Phytophthora palmivora TaxID=4796 RepID=A0A2P4X768_9STRA|nr:LOW QUALITY PROTEIN: hypothetical protein PHPALM_29597 [Phytophthora palmivora]
MKTLQQRMKDTEAERDREKGSSQNMQRVQAGQLRILRATLSQVQEARRVGHPDLATATPVLDTEDPEVAIKYPVFGSEIRSEVRVEPMSHPPALKTAPREVATFQQTAPARSSVTKRVKAERNGAAATTTTTTQVTRVASVTEAKGDITRASTPRRDPPRKSDARRFNGDREVPRREKRRGEAPDPGGDSEDSSSESESSSSDDSEFGDVVNLTTATQAQAGTTLLTLRPFMNSNNLGEFDPRATLRKRIHWWERFTNMASPGGWSTETRIQELKLKLLVSARDWFNQLPKSVSRDWKELSSESVTYSERYFTMPMKDSETPLEFFYRLNSAAGKADIDFRKSSKRLEKHVLRFITKLKDAHLKTSLQGQRFRHISDLEYALQQDEDVWRTDTAPTSSSASTALPSADWTQTLTNEVYRVMGDMGWRPPPHSPAGSSDVLKMAVIGIARNVNAQDTQKKTAGGISRVTGARKMGIQVECVEHPPCETLETLKQLARQGALKDMPNHLRERLLGDEADSGKPLN